MKYARIGTMKAAWDAAKATCMARSRQLGVSYPIPHGEVIGMPPHDLDTNPDHYATHYLTAPVEGVDGDWYLPVSREMEALPEGTERVGDADVSVVRDGVERPAEAFFVVEVDAF